MLFWSAHYKPDRKFRSTQLGTGDLHLEASSIMRTSIHYQQHPSNDPQQTKPFNMSVGTRWMSNTEGRIEPIRRAPVPLSSGWISSQRHDFDRMNKYGFHRRAVYCQLADGPQLLTNPHRVDQMHRTAFYLSGSFWQSMNFAPSRNPRKYQLWPKILIVNVS